MLAVARLNNVESVTKYSQKSDFKLYVISETASYPSCEEEMCTDLTQYISIVVSHVDDHTGCMLSLLQEMSFSHHLVSFH